MSNKTRSLKGSLEALLPGAVEDPQRALLTVARELYVGLNTPVSLGLEILLRYGELEQVIRKRVNPLDYNDELSFRLDYQAVNFLAKAPLKVSGVDPQAKAVQSFLESEDSCRQTNHRIRVYRDSPHTAGPLIHTVLHGAARLISETLGLIDWNEWLSKCRFGPGADSSTADNRTSAYDKLLTKPEATRDAIPLACMLINEVHGLQCSFGRDPAMGPQQTFAEGDLESVRGNRITFVPKSAVTHRTIAIEPHMNIYMQLGVGGILRRKLRRRGLDLDSQEGNQFLARKGSVDGSLCTIDLSAASDTLSRELVRELIPDPWFRLMDALRSKVGLLRGEGSTTAVIRYEKFSSMGNGFTFELETLIFWALARSVLEVLGIPSHDSEGLPTVRVYGDDIVCPTTAYRTMVDVLSWCGFSTNDRKSYFSGYFRESCGKDYFAGTLVRPFFQKELPSDVQALFRMANGLRRAASRSCAHYGCDNRFELAWRHTVRRLPKPFRAFYQPAYKGVNPYEVADCFATDPRGYSSTSSSEEGLEASRWVWRPDRPIGPRNSGERRSRFKETPSAEEQPLRGLCMTDDSIALIGNTDEAMGSPYCMLKLDRCLQRTAHVTMGVRARPRGFEWKSSEINVFGVLLYETRNGREIAQGMRSTTRGAGKRHVVWLHWEQWRDLGPWCERSNLSLFAPRPSLIG